MHSILAVTSTESGRHQPGVVCLLVPWSRISDPLLDSGAAPPAALSLHTRLPLGAVCPRKPVCLSFWPCLSHLGPPLSTIIFPRPLCLHICLSAFIFLSFICQSFCLSLIFYLHLADEDVNISFHWKQITLKMTHMRSQTVMRGLNFKHCCLHETNNYCQLKISGLSSFVYLLWSLNWSKLNCTQH